MTAKQRRIAELAAIAVLAATGAALPSGLWWVTGILVFGASALLLVLADRKPLTPPRVAYLAAIASGVAIFVRLVK